MFCTGQEKDRERKLIIVLKIVLSNILKLQIKIGYSKPKKQNSLQNNVKYLIGRYVKKQMQIRDRNFV